MSGALAARPTDKELEKGRVEKTTVKRYWPGRAPAWIEQQQQEAAAAVPAEDALAQQVQRTAISAPVIVKKVADPRLARLAQRSTDRDEAVEEHRQIRAAEVVRRRHRPAESEPDEQSGSEESSSSEEEEEEPQEQEEDEEELQRRRDALKERWEFFCGRVGGGGVWPQAAAPPCPAAEVVVDTLTASWCCTALGYGGWDVVGWE